MTDPAFDDVRYALPYADGMQEHYWTVARQRILQDLLEKLPGHRPGRSVLDVGCGRGFEVASLRRAGFAAIGCDLGRPVPGESSLAPHLHLGVGAASLPAPVRAGIEVLMFLDVLEHLAEPASVLSGTLSAFPAAREVLVTVPARQELWSNYDQFFGHHRRYDRRSLGSLAAAAGCEVLDSGYFFRILYPPARLLVAMGRERSLEIRPPGAWAPVHRLIAGLCVLDYHSMPRALPGTSLYALLRPRT